MHRESSFFTAKHFITVFIISVLLSAAYMRLYKIRGYMTYLGDEGRDVLMVKRMIVDGDITFIGPTASVAAFFLGPFYYYLMAPFLWLWRLDPVGPAIMVALFGVATVYLIFRVTRQWYGTFAAVTASTLYALSPLAVAQSRSSWNPNVVPFFALFYVYSLFQALTTKRKRWWVATAGFCIGAGVQLHYLFLFLVPISLILFTYKTKKKELIPRFLHFSGGVILPLVPFLAFEIKNNFPNFRTIIRFLTAGKEVAYSASPWSVVSDVVFRLFARLVFYFPGPEQLYRFEPSTLEWWRIGIITAIVLSTVMLVYNSFRYKKLHDILLLTWLFFGTILFIFYQKAIYDYYLVIVFPVPFIMTGMLLQRWWNKPYFWPLSLSILLLLGLLNWSGRPFLSSPNNQVGHAEQVSRAVFEEAGSRPFNFALITSSNSDHAYRYFFEIWGNHPVAIENFEVDPDRTSVTDQLLVICEQADCKPLGHPLWEVAGFGQAEIEREWTAEGLRVFKLVHSKGEMIQ